MKSFLQLNILSTHLLTLYLNTWLKVKLSLTLWVPAAHVMQGLVDVGRKGSSFLAAHSADIHQSIEPQWTTHYCSSPRYQKLNFNPFTPKNVQFTVIWCLKSPMTRIGLILSHPSPLKVTDNAQALPHWPSLVYPPVPHAGCFVPCWLFCTLAT